MKTKNKEGLREVLHWLFFGLMVGFIGVGPGEIIGLLIGGRGFDLTARDWAVIAVGFAGTIIFGRMCWKTRHTPSANNENHKQEG